MEIKNNNIQPKKTIFNGNSFELLYSNPNLEIIKGNLKANTFDIIKPVYKSESVKNIFILTGKIAVDCYQEKPLILSNNDTLTLTNKSNNHLFKAIEDTVILVICNYQGFNQKMDQLEQLSNILTKLHQKDVKTKEHCLRVQQLTMKIADELNIHNNLLSDLFYAACFHDVGKIAIPTEILLKPGPLNDQEKEIIKKHPQISYQMIKDILSNEASQMVFQHHERIDGSGYPQGLAGDKINLGAKIIAVADAYDALVTSRPYCGSMEVNEAITILKQFESTHYDKQIINALINCLKKDNLLTSK